MTEEVCTAYRVSTITCNGNIGCKVNLEAFYNAMNIVKMTDNVSGIVWAKIGDGAQKGLHPKKRKPRIIKKMFDNQMTFVYWFADKYHPNVKVFRNGNVQMTGIKNPDDGLKMVQYVSDEIARLNNEIVEKENKILCEGDIPKVTNFVIRMINSDFTVPFKIRRKDLFLILVNKYHKSCSFQAETYPGVKLQYYYNKANTTEESKGSCNCTVHCFGKESGNGNGKCKKVTVAVFQSGKILITGSNTFDQVNEAYNYISKVIIDNKKKIHWLAPVLPD